MNYQRPVFPWIIAALFVGEALVFAILASLGVRPFDGVLWLCAALITGIFGVIVAAMKLKQGMAPSSGSK